MIFVANIAHDEAISCFKGKLKDILKRELSLENKIYDVRKDYPYEGNIAIILEKPFTPPIYKDENNIIFTNTNDPHYWKADYFDSVNELFLACGFGGKPDFSEL